MSEVYNSIDKTNSIQVVSFQQNANGHYRAIVAAVEAGINNIQTGSDYSAGKQFILDCLGVIQSYDADLYATLNQKLEDKLS
jgi:hypothetical protein